MNKTLVAVLNYDEVNKVARWMHVGTDERYDIKSFVQDGHPESRNQYGVEVVEVPKDRFPGYWGNIEAICRYAKNQGYKFVTLADSDHLGVLKVLGRNQVWPRQKDIEGGRDAWNNMKCKLVGDMIDEAMELMNADDKLYSVGPQTTLFPAEPSIVDIWPFTSWFSTFRPEVLLEILLTAKEKLAPVINKIQQIDFVIPVAAYHLGYHHKRNNGYAVSFTPPRTDNFSILDEEGNQLNRNYVNDYNIMLLDSCFDDVVIDAWPTQSGRRLHVTDDKKPEDYHFRFVSDFKHQYSYNNRENAAMLREYKGEFNERIKNLSDRA